MAIEQLYARKKRNPLDPDSTLQVITGGNRVLSQGPTGMRSIMAPDPSGATEVDPGSGMRVPKATMAYQGMRRNVPSISTDQLRGMGLSVSGGKETPRPEQKPAVERAALIGEAGKMGLLRGGTGLGSYGGTTNDYMNASARLAGVERQKMPNKGYAPTAEFTPMERLEAAKSMTVDTKKLGDIEGQQQQIVSEREAAERKTEAEAGRQNILEQKRIESEGQFQAGGMAAQEKAKAETVGAQYGALTALQGRMEGIAENRRSEQAREDEASRRSEESMAERLFRADEAEKQRKADIERARIGAEPRAEATAAKREETAAKYGEKPITAEILEYQELADMKDRDRTQNARMVELRGIVAQQMSESSPAEQAAAAPQRKVSVDEFKRLFRATRKVEPTQADIDTARQYGYID